MFEDRSVKAVICACAEVMAQRGLSRKLTTVSSRAARKFLGLFRYHFLHTAIRQNTGLITFHGPMLSSDIGKEDVHPLTRRSFRQLFQKMTLTYTEELSPLETLGNGAAKGELVGGNLALLVTTLGTPYEIDTKGKLLFIEDVDEEPYRIDRMLNQLNMAGKLSDAAGILLCDFHNCIPKKRGESLTLKEVFQDYIAAAGKPALSGFNIGHCSPNIAVPVGVQAVLDADKKQLTIDPGIS